MQSVRRHRGELVQIGESILIDIVCIDYTTRSVVMQIHKPRDMHVYPLEGQRSRAEMRDMTAHLSRQSISTEWLKELGFNEVSADDRFEPDFEIDGVRISQCDSGAWCLDQADFVEMNDRQDLLTMLRLCGFTLLTAHGTSRLVRTAEQLA